jgi:hypothetical protein
MKLHVVFYSPIHKIYFSFKELHGNAYFIEQTQEFFSISLINISFMELSYLKGRIW